MKAILFAAGLGTRLKPWTDEHPKALVPVNGKTLLQRNIEYLQYFGIRELIINVHHFAEQVIDFLNVNHNFGCEISISLESHEALETGGGLFKAAWFFSDQQPFLAMNVDILTNLHLGQLIDAHMQNRPLATLAVSDRETSRYFLFDQHKRLCGWKNVKTGENKIAYLSAIQVAKAFSGIHIIDPEIFSKSARAGKFSLVDLYLELAQSNKIMGYDHTGDLLIDVGKPQSLEEAEKYFH
jgi:NDP-sugar pyrophosphorylase family protein